MSGYQVEFWMCLYQKSYRMQLNLQDQDTNSTWIKREREKPMNCNVKRGRQQRKTFSNWKKIWKHWLMFVNLWKRMLTSVLKRQKGSPEVRWHSSLANQMHCGDSWKISRRKRRIWKTKLQRKLFNLATLINVLVQNILILLSICNAGEFSHSLVFKRKKTNLCS